ncbi:MAG: YigZ family protein [Erysipelotrichaceae bacterium]|nr:YigZ family protein [Erysipelotrichaceae bacterium]
MYLKSEATNTIIIERSRFITYMKRVKSEEEYRNYLAEIRKKHHDATHVCSAMICKNIRRSSDDGEPSGTAGAPILGVLDKKGLDETCALVVRYFGGIKLGAGGLIRAYSSSVSECVKNAILIEEVSLPKYELKVSYETANKIDHYLRNNTILSDTAYDTDVTYFFALDDEGKIEKIKEFTKGIAPSKIGEEIIEKEVK